MFTVSRLAVGASTSGFGLLGVWAAEVLLTWDLSWPKWVVGAKWASLGCENGDHICPIFL